MWATGDTGAGIVIGGSDTGVDGSHPALRASYRGGDDSWFDPWNHSRAPVDHNGHGTHTIGSALGTGGIGVAPGAQWMACVNLDRDMANPAFYLDCLQFMLAPFPFGGNPFTDGDPTRAADVLTNSWGCPALEGCDRTRTATGGGRADGGRHLLRGGGRQRGPSLFARSTTPRHRTRPRSRSAPSIGTEPWHRFPAGGRSARETKPDVVAPGVGVVSALPGGGYGALDGTSMATPQVAGVVALMWSASPVLRGNVAKTAQILRDTATPASPSTASLGGGSCGGAAQTGAGLVNAAAAVAAARSLNRQPAR